MLVQRQPGQRERSAGARVVPYGDKRDFAKPGWGRDQHQRRALAQRGGQAAGQAITVDETRPEQRRVELGVQEHVEEIYHAGKASRLNRRWPSTLAHRHTPVPTEIPAALTDEFVALKQHQVLVAVCRDPEDNRGIVAAKTSLISLFTAKCPRHLAG